MSFQTQAYNKQALGNAGEISRAFNHYCNTDAVIVADDNICVGCFVQLKANSTNEREVIGASGCAINGKILGVVIRDKLSDDCIVENGKITYRKGQTATILTSGNVFIECEGEAKKGQYVELNKTSGALVFSDTLSDTNANTGFIVSVGNESGDGIIEITTSGAK